MTNDEIKKLLEENEKLESECNRKDGYIIDMAKKLDFAEQKGKELLAKIEKLEAVRKAAQKIRSDDPYLSGSRVVIELEQALEGAK